MSPPMHDPVNAADVLARECGHPQWCVFIEGNSDDGAHLVDALLACGDGDPVVIMPDGTLLRLVNTAEAFNLPGMFHLADPVQP